MAAVHVQGLLLSHFAEVFHRQEVLCPILEHRPITAVGNELFRVLRHRWIQVVLYHQHDGRRPWRFARIVFKRPSMHVVGRLEPVHVNASKFLKLF